MLRGQSSQKIKNARTHAIRESMDQKKQSDFLTRLAEQKAVIKQNFKGIKSSKNGLKSL